MEVLGWYFAGVVTGVICTTAVYVLTKMPPPPGGWFDNQPPPSPKHDTSTMWGDD